MGREGSKIHKWTKEDETKLLDAIQTCTPLMEHYQRQGRNIENWWDGVAGRLLPGIQVTGGACRRRYLLIQERKKDARATEEEETTDKWELTKQMVEEYEAEVSERLQENLQSLLHISTSIRELLTNDLHFLENKVALIDKKVTYIYQELIGDIEEESPVTRIHPPDLPEEEGF
jgi:hypothetical protein